MESTRNYRESTLNIRRYVVSRYTESGTELQAADQNGEKPGTENTEENGNTEQNKTGNQTASLNDWQGRMQVSTAKIRVRSRESQTLDQIRQRTVRYIFDLLFAYRRNRLGSWGQENSYGSSSGNETEEILRQTPTAQGT